MENQSPTPQTTEGPLTPKRFVNWDDALLRIDGLPEQHIYFGIPRGGTIIAGLARARGYAVTSNVLDATALLDDLIDSGATKEKWMKEYGLPFFTLWNKQEEKHNDWYVFPWDNETEATGEDVVRRTLQLIGEDPNREGLLDTPSRVVRMWRDLFSGYSQDPAHILKRDFDRDGYDQMIVCRDIEFHSTCEHHLLPFFGTATVAYIPNKKIVGLSKLARLVDAYARRLQIQERMTEQIAAALESHLQPRGSAVVIEAKHYCMICRGVQKQQSSMVTSALKGFFFDDVKARAEFYQLVHSR